MKVENNSKLFGFIGRWVFQILFFLNKISIKGEENLYNLIERGTDAIEELIQVAKESEHPRAYEVVGQLLKTVGETNGKLLEIHKMKKDITREEQEVSIRSQNVTNALFVGSTAELQKLLNNRET